MRQNPRQERHAVSHREVGSLVGPIEQDLHISDTAMSLLMGLDLPAGAMIDRMRRKWIIVGGVTFWSFATMSCGLASSYWQLFFGPHRRRRFAADAALLLL